jgi:hypothetical protein
MPTKKKFDEDDRRRVIAVIEQHFGISLKAIDSYRKYLRDEHGSRYIVLGGYEDWHGIPRKIFAAEEASPADTTLIIAKRSKTAIDIFSGPLRPLLDRKDDLPKTNHEYVFNLSFGANGLKVREAPNLVLRRLDETRYSVEEKQAEIRAREIAALVGGLSTAERAELIRRLKEHQ